MWRSIFDPRGPERPGPDVVVTVEATVTYTEWRYESAPAPQLPQVSAQELAARMLAELEYQHRTGRPSAQLEAARQAALPPAPEPDWYVTATVQEPDRRPAPYRLPGQPPRKSIARHRAIEGGTQ